MPGELIGQELEALVHGEDQPSDRKALVDLRGIDDRRVALKWHSKSERDTWIAINSADWRTGTKARSECWEDEEFMVPLAPHCQDFKEKDLAEKLRN